MIDHNANFSNLDGIESGGLSPQCLVVDQDPLTKTLSLLSCLRDQKLFGPGQLHSQDALFCFGYAQR